MSDESHGTKKQKKQVKKSSEIKSKSMSIFKINTCATKQAPWYRIFEVTDLQKIFWGTAFVQDLRVSSINKYDVPAQKKHPQKRERLPSSKLA